MHDPLHRSRTLLTPPFPPKPPVAQGGLSVPQLYVLLGLAYALLSLPLMFGPRTTAHWLYGSAARPVEDQHGHTLGLVATTLVTIVSAAFALEVRGPRAVSTGSSAS